MKERRRERGREGGREGGRERERERAPPFSPSLMHLPELADPASRGRLASGRRSRADADFTPRLSKLDGRAALPHSARVSLYSGSGAEPLSSSQLQPHQPLSARSQPGSSRRHHTPRTASSAPVREAERLLAAERQLDSYVTAVSKETLLSEQYSKELAHTRERIKQLATQVGPRGSNPVSVLESLNRSRARAMKRTSGMESRLSELQKYNLRLVETINALRKQSAPHRQLMKKALANTQKRHADMQQLKQRAIKALDERDRYKAQLRVLREEAAQEHNHFVNALNNSEAQLERLEDEYDRSAEELSAATEAAKKQQFLQMKQKRAQKEKLDVRYGYLRSQLEAIDGEFRKLERIVGVHFLPGDPGSLENIISKFIERETHIASLQKFWARQNEESEVLRAEIASLESQAAALGSANGLGRDVAEGPDHVGAADKAAATVEALEAAAELAAKEADAKEKVDEICELVARLFSTAGCDGSFALGVQGCSASNVQDFLSAIEAKLDAVELSALELRSNAETLRVFVARPQNEVLEKFVEARTSLSLSRPGESLTLPDRKNLPSVADQDLLMNLESTEGGSPSPTRRSAGIDKRKVGDDIEAWKMRQLTARSPRPGMNQSLNDTPRGFKAANATHA